MSLNSMSNNNNNVEQRKKVCKHEMLFEKNALEIVE